MDDVLPELRPPPGGLGRLRGRLDAPRRAVWWVPVAVAAAIGLAFALRDPAPSVRAIPADAALPTLAARLGVPEGARDRVAAGPPEALADGSVLIRVGAIPGG
jgi:hypothetical protein